MRILLCGAVALALVGCGGSSKNSGASTGGSTAPSASTSTAAGGTTTAGGSSGAGSSSTTTSGGGGGLGVKATGSFCADVRNGAVSTALLDAANPTNSSVDELKKINSEAPSEIKSDVSTMLQVLTQIRDAGTDSAKQAALASAGPQLSAAGAHIGTYISAHCS